MCDYCKEMLGSFATPHEKDARCPLRKSQYCYTCAGYGHSATECTDPLRSYGSEDAPQFLEQLIPPSVREKFGIVSKTPIHIQKGPQAVPSAAPMIVPHTEEDVRAALIREDEKPMVCQTAGKKENRELQENVKRLQKLADKRGRKLILVPAATAKSAPK